MRHRSLIAALVGLAAMGGQGAMKDIPMNFGPGTGNMSGPSWRRVKPWRAAKHHTGVRAQKRAARTRQNIRAKSSKRKERA